MFVDESCIGGDYTGPGGGARDTVLKACTEPVSKHWKDEYAATKTIGVRSISTPLAPVVEGCTLTLGGAPQETAAATTCTLTSADPTDTPAVVGSCAVATGSGSCAYVAPVVGSTGGLCTDAAGKAVYAPDQATCQATPSNVWDNSAGE